MKKIFSMSMQRFVAEVDIGCHFLMTQFMQSWLGSFQLSRTGYPISFVDIFINVLAESIDHYFCRNCLHVFITSVRFHRGLFIMAVFFIKHRHFDKFGCKQMTSIHHVLHKETSDVLYITLTNLNSPL